MWDTKDILESIPWCLNNLCQFSINSGFCVITLPQYPLVNLIYFKALEAKGSVQRFSNFHASRFHLKSCFTCLLQWGEFLIFTLLDALNTFENKPDGRNFRINKSLQNSQRILLHSFYSLVQIMLLLFYPMEFSCVLPRCSELGFQNGHYSQWTDKHPVMILLLL